MSFSIKLGTTTDPDNKISKSITDVLTVNGTLKANTSVITPKILIKGNLSTIAGCNYMKIDSFGRYYFITDMVSVTNDLVEVTGKVDVLTTYAPTILTNTAIFKKSQTLWNSYLDDGGILKLGYEDQSITKFPAGFTENSYVLIVAGA